MGSLMVYGKDVVPEVTDTTIMSLVLLMWGTGEYGDWQVQLI